MELFAGSYEVQALRDENQWLLQCLHASEQSCKQLQSVVKQQQRRIKKLERAASADQSAGALIERQWRSRLQQKEAEWMQEYDSQMQSLLRIIHHHESVHTQLENELHESRGAAVECVSSAAQTDFLSNDDDDGVDAAASVPSLHAQQAAKHNDDEYSSCSHASRQQEMEHECPPHPFAIQLQTSTVRTHGFNLMSQIFKLHDHIRASDGYVRIDQLDDLHRMDRTKEQQLPLSPSAA